MERRQVGWHLFICTYISVSCAKIKPFANSFFEYIWGSECECVCDSAIARRFGAFSVEFQINLTRTCSLASLEMRWGRFFFHLVRVANYENNSKPFPGRLDYNGHSNTSDWTHLRNSQMHKIEWCGLLHNISSEGLALSRIIAEYILTKRKRWF